MPQLPYPLKVVELASVLAGPAVGMFFAELGATVVKVENKTTQGDVTRRWKLPTENANSPFSAYYASVNWNKQVVWADLTDPDDRASVLKLLADADVVISNFKTTSARKMGMDYETLRSLNPRLIYAQLTAFGEAAEERPAFDVVLQAEAGFLAMTGEPNGNPVKMPIALIDLLAAHQLKEGILLALWQRERTGQGCYVTTSLLESAIASLANQATNYLMAGHIPQPMGTLHPNIAPYGDMFRTKDGKFLILAVGSEKQFRHLCQTLQTPQLLDHPSFITNSERLKNRQALTVHLQNAFENWNRSDILSLLHAASVPVGSLRTMDEVFELPAAQALLLHETLPDGSTSVRVKTVVFDLR